MALFNQPPVPDRVSVVMSVHNGLLWLRETLACLQRIDYDALEIIVVDNGSTDGSGALARAMLPKAVHIGQENRGLVAGRNRGLAACSGMFVQLLDADDLITPDKLRRQVSALHNNAEAALAVCSWATFSDDPNQTTPQHSRLVTRMWPGVLAGCPFPPHVPLIRRSWLERVGLFRDGLWCDDDWDLWIRLFAAGARQVSVPDVLALYRVHPGQTTQTSSWTQLCASHKHLLMYYMDQCIAHNVLHWAAPAACFVTAYLVRRSLNASDFDMARRLLDWAGRLSERITDDAAGTTVHSSRLGRLWVDGLTCAAQLGLEQTRWSNGWNRFLETTLPGMDQLERLDLLLGAHAQWSTQRLWDDVAALDDVLQAINRHNLALKQHVPPGHRWARLTEQLTRLDPQIAGHHRLALYGAGLHARWLLTLAWHWRDRIVCLIDDDPDQQGQTLWSIPIVSPAQAKAEVLDAIILSTDTYQTQLVQAAVKHGLADGQTRIICLDQRDNINGNQQKLQHAVEDQL